MLAVALLVLSSPPSFASPIPWALGFAAAPRIPLVGDVNHDGLADLIAVYPVGDCIIDVSLNVEGMKAGPGFQGITNWGKDCQAATVGEFDDVPGADVVGIFQGKSLRLAGAFANGHFKDTPNWISLPKSLSRPALATLDGGKIILAFSTNNGDAFRIDTAAKTSAPCRVPAHLVWIGDAGSTLAAQDVAGNVFLLDKTTFAKGQTIGVEPKDSRPTAAAGMVAFGDKCWTPDGVVALPKSNLPEAESIKGVGAFEKGGTNAIVDFRNGHEAHSATQILLRLPADEAGLATSTANDGLLDAWKLNGYRGLDMKAMGCDPKHADVICLISRFKGVNEARFKTEIDRVVKFYNDLKVQNPDGTTGIHFHPIFLPPIQGDDEKNPWQVNRDKFRPDKWRGVVHWMQVTPGGGGQADELGDGGTCGEGALWAVFVHEFGHQLGMDHSGFWPNGSCPIYTSLMNYNYSYGYEDDRNKIHYSDGSLDKIVLKETDLDEVLPYPYEKVKFLEKGPYHYRLKPNGATTLIDWNWNGVFGEHHVKANINYAYSISAGDRQDIGRTKTAPWLFLHEGHPYALFGTNDLPVDPKVQPTITASRPGRLLIRHLIKGHDWSDVSTIESGGLIGDPVAASFGGKIFSFYQTDAGVMMRTLATSKDGLGMSEPVAIEKDKTLIPTVGNYAGDLVLFVTNPSSGVVTYRIMSKPGLLGPAMTLDVPSTNPPGICTDSLSGEAVVAVGANQDKGRTFRWQIRRYRLQDGKLRFVSMDWVQGESGGARGQGRLIPLFDPSKEAGPHGRIYLFSRGFTDSVDAPWCCSYVAMQVADKTVTGGWLVKRYYDEWTVTRSAPAACWYQNDILFAYRWTDGGQGASDNVFHIAYGGLGIDPAPMGDHDDLSFIRNFGLENSLIWLSKA